MRLSFKCIVFSNHVSCIFKISVRNVGNLLPFRLINHVLFVTRPSSARAEPRSRGLPKIADCASKPWITTASKPWITENI